MGNSEHREEAGSSVQGKRCNHNPPGFSANVAFSPFFFLFLFFWSNAMLFEVTTKYIKKEKLVLCIGIIESRWALHVRDPLPFL